MKKVGSVQEYMDDLPYWQKELTKLREVMLSVGFDETVKWSVPVYTAGGKNVAGLIGTKHYFGIWFYQGALLNDQNKFLVNAQEGKTKALRQWRMTSSKDIKVRTIKQYLMEAISLAEAGKEIKPNRNKPIIVPAELENVLAANPKAKKLFDELNKTRRREFADHISEAKRTETKLRRIEKIIPMILKSEGLHDKYR